MKLKNKETFYSRQLGKSIIRNYDLYLMLLPVVIYIIIFNYLPMFGIQIAFKDYFPTDGIWGSPFVGLKHFKRFFRSHYFSRLIINTLKIRVTTILFNFPIPIIFAIMINELGNKKYKKVIQTVSYAPHFISTVVMVSMLTLLLSPQNGIINKFISVFGIEPIYFMGEEKYFVGVYVASAIWQGLGWSSIIYIAALSNISQEVVEAATIDGATRFQRIIHVSIPCILPTVVIMLINSVGHIMSVGFEKVLLMQNELNMRASNVISTYTYRAGLVGGEYSFATAVELFNSVINFILLISVNRVSKKLSETSLW